MALTSWFHRHVAAYQNAANLRWRRPPRLRVYAASGRPTVYYLAPFADKPSGGVKVMYRHVDLLNEIGIPAAVLHEPDDLRCTWFTNETRIVSASTIRLCADDILVIPECYGPGLPLLPIEVRKLIFNQGPYHTFDLIDFETTSAGAPYRGVPNLVGILTVSHDAEQLLSLAFPELPVAISRPVVDAKVFHPGGQPGKRRLAYVPSRRSEELHQLRHLLRARGVDWEMLPISGKSEREVAEILRDCAVFLSLSERDGFGLPPAEAMASGCYVVGYPGGGGSEFFDPAYCSPVADLTGFGQAVLRTVSRPLLEVAELGAKASAHILGHYTEAGLRGDLRLIYGPLT